MTEIQKPSSEQAEQSPSDEQVFELIQEAGTLIADAVEAVNSHILQAQEEGLSSQEIEEFLKDLWRDSKIPRLAVSGNRDRSTTVRVFEVEAIDTLEFNSPEELSGFDSSSASSTPPIKNTGGVRVGTFPGVYGKDPIRQLDVFEDRNLFKPVTDLQRMGAEIPPADPDEFRRLQALIGHIQSSVEIGEA